MNQKVNSEAVTNSFHKILGKRFLAYLLDWYIGAMLTALPIGIVSQKLYGTMLNQNLLSFTKPYGLICGILSLLCSLIYYVAIPLGKNKGQTLGKKLLHLKIVKENGEDVDFKAIFIRQVIGIILIEGGLYTASVIWQQVIELTLAIPVVTFLKFLGLGLSILSALLLAFHKNHKPIHDYIAKTMVVDIKD